MRIQNRVTNNCSRLLILSLLLIPVLASAAETEVINTGWISILPPLLAIFLALWFKRVIPALFAGIWIGAWAINGGNIFAVWTGLLDTFQKYILGALADSDHAAVILFSMMVGGMVGIISRNGGLQGIVNHIVRWADSARHATIATYALGMAIFFDDYANTLVVGNTMRPVTDRFHISRAKLAYIVDSTAAPVAAIAIITTWIGAEVGYIGDAISKSGIESESAYIIFLRTIPYSFYPLLTLLFVGFIAFGRRDFGPMLKAERRALEHAAGPQANIANADLVEPMAGKPQRPLNAIIPVVVLIVSLIGGLFATGEGESLKDIIGSSDSYKALMWASMLAVLAAALISMAQRILTLEDVIESWFSGARVMLMAMVILLLAWALGKTTEGLGTANFLVSLLGEGFPQWILPTLVFVLSAATAFATGSSWGTMGILMPLVVPLSFAILQVHGIDQPVNSPLFAATIAGVLGGAVWGDHCSPISDTTIMSSMATGCDHIEHVHTQLPYALTVGFTAIVFGTLPAGFGIPWWISLISGAIVLMLIYRFVARPISAAD